MNLYPSILTESLVELEEQVTATSQSKDVSVVQIDIIDGFFADNVTISPLDLTQVDFDNLKIDFHLLVEEPMDFVLEIVGIKDYVPIRSIIAQVERMSQQGDFVREVLTNEWRVGVSLDLHTPVSAIDDESWDYLQIVQLMTIEAGFQGLEFHHSALGKISEIRNKSRYPVEIIVDGGVKAEHIPLLTQAGVDGVVVGSGIWSPETAIEHFTDLMQTEE